MKEDELGEEGGEEKTCLSRLFVILLWYERPVDADFCRSNNCHQLLLLQWVWSHDPHSPQNESGCWSYGLSSSPQGAILVTTSR